jgi:hypothetical protein
MSGQSQSRGSQSQAGAAACAGLEDSGVHDVSNSPAVEAERNFRGYPTLNSCFKVTARAGSRGISDATCLFCSHDMLSIKPDRLAAHSMSCVKTPDDLRDQLGDERDILRDKARSKLSGATGASDNIMDLLINLFANNCLPVSLIDRPEMISLIKMARPRFVVPARTRFTSIIKTQSDKIRAAQLESLQGGSDFSIAVEFDGWKNINGTHILAIVVSRPDGRSILLNLQDITRVQHSGELIAKLVVETLKTANLPRKLFNSVVTDEGANYKLARAKLIESFTPKIQPLQYRCMAHVLNLVGERMSKSIELSTTLSRANNLVNIISRHRILASRLTDDGARKIAHVVATRWYSLSRCLLSLLDTREPFCRLPTNDDSLSPSSWQDTVHDPKFWSELKTASEYFSRLSSYIALAESSTSMLSDSFRGLLEFAEFCDNRPLDDLIKYAAIGAFDYHFNKLDKPLMFACYILNPNHKLDFLTEDAFKEGRRAIVTTILKSNLDKEVVNRVIASEMTAYLKCLAKEKNFIGDVAAWWRKQPWVALKRAGIRFATCRGSSANTERLFSGLSLIMTPKRNRMSLDLLHDLMNIRLFNLSGRDTPPRPRNSSRSDEDDEVDINVDNPLDPDHEDSSCSQGMSQDLHHNPDRLTFRRYITFDKLQSYYHCSVNPREADDDDDEEDADRDMEEDDEGANQAELDADEIMRQFE